MDDNRDSKIAFSHVDWSLAADTSFILTKNAIIREVYEIFGSLVGGFEESAQPLRLCWPEAFSASPKISKGEQYQGMPWVVLDYPRCFSRHRGHCAIRCFFWWGHFFSINLQLSGEYATSIYGLIPHLQQREWMVGYTLDPWNFNPLPQDWVAAQEIGSVNDNYFLKASKTLPIARHSEAKEFYQENYIELVELIANQLPMR